MKQTLDRSLSFLNLLPLICFPRSKSLIIRKPAQTGEFFNTASWVNLARAKLCILVKDATNSIFNPEQLKQEDSNEK